MYDNARSKVKITNSYSNPIIISVGVHQGSVLSPLLFITVMEALSEEFRTGCPWEPLYTNGVYHLVEVKPTQKNLGDQIWAKTVQNLTQN